MYRRHLRGFWVDNSPGRALKKTLGSLFLGLLLAVGACKLEEGTSPTSSTPPDVGSSEGQPPTAPPAEPGTTPPAIVSPEPGSEVSTSSPTLTVRNATTDDGSTPTYTFQVATDSDFDDIVAREPEVREGSGGQTSWQVGKALEARKHFWRVFADIGAKRLTSEVANFTVPAQTAPTGGGAVLVSDPLTNFTSVGEVNGGAFTSRGWEVRAQSNYIRYRIPTVSSGYVEFSTTGLNHNAPYVRLRWISGGEQHDEGHNFTNWNPSQVYRWRIQWGPAGAGNVVDVFVDGTVLMTASYGPSYSPGTHWVELGIAERKESIQGVTYSNVEIGTK
jgi:hypothetical protein